VATSACADVQPRGTGSAQNSAHSAPVTVKVKSQLELSDTWSVSVSVPSATRTSSRRSPTSSSADHGWHGGSPSSGTTRSLGSVWVAASGTVFGTVFGTVSGTVIGTSVEQWTRQIVRLSDNIRTWLEW
jgi:hypothetical protein